MATVSKAAAAATSGGGQSKTKTEKGPEGEEIERSMAAIARRVLTFLFTSTSKRRAAHYE